MISFAYWQDDYLPEKDMSPDSEEYEAQRCEGINAQVDCIIEEQESQFEYVPDVREFLDAMDKRRRNERRERRKRNLQTYRGMHEGSGSDWEDLP